MKVAPYCACQFHYFEPPHHHPDQTRPRSKVDDGVLFALHNNNNNLVPWFACLNYEAPSHYYFTGRAAGAPGRWYLAIVSLVGDHFMALVEL